MARGGWCSRAPEIALGTGRSVYDRVYLALAIALDCRLVTADERLVNAFADGPLGRHVLWVGTPGRYSAHSMHMAR